MSEGGRYRFGDFEFDAAAERLSRDGVEVPLAPQPLAFLRLLVDSNEQLVTREQARLHLWGERQVEYQQGLNFCVRQVRAALEDSAAEPRYLQTVPRRGFRFVAPVQRVDPQPSSGRSAVTSAAAVAAKRALPAVATVAVMLAVAAAWWSPWSDRAPRSFGEVIVAATQVEGVNTEQYVAAALRDRLRQDLAGEPSVDLVDQFSEAGEGYRFRVLTSLHVLEATVRVEIKLLESGQEHPVWSAVATVPAAALLPLEQDLRGDLLTHLVRFVDGEATGGVETVERERMVPSAAPEAAIAVDGGVPPQH
jgi:DNA-binding winged helix-turn-helix (wHTH) protein